MTFNLREHARKILAATAGENLSELVDAVFTSTPAELYAEAYHQALRDVVRNVIRHVDRPAPETARLDHEEGAAHGKVIEPGQDSSGEGVICDPSPKEHASLPAGPNLRNSRAARLLRRNQFRQSIWVGDGVYRNILECTVADLEHAAAESEKLAEQNDAAARRYRKLVKLMAEHHAEKVQDLTDEQIAEVFGDE